MTFETGMQERKQFENVAMYLGSPQGRAYRIDCRSVTVQTGLQYAQHTDAIRIAYVGRGQRRSHLFYLTHEPFMVLIAVAEAWEPGGTIDEFVADIRRRRISVLFQVHAANG